MEKDPVSGVRRTFILLVSGSERTEGMENLGTSEELAVCVRRAAFLIEKPLKLNPNVWVLGKQ